MGTNRVVIGAAVSEVLNVIIATSKDVCRNGLREANLLDRYGRICLALDEITAQVNGALLLSCLSSMSASKCRFLLLLLLCAIYNAYIVSYFNVNWCQPNLIRAPFLDHPGNCGAY